jgi:hypothetical protein
MSEILFRKRKKEISFDTSPSQTKEKPSFENSRHAPFLLFSLKTNNRHLSQKQMKITLVGAPFPPKRGAPTLQQRKNPTSSWGLQQVSLEPEPELEPVLLQALVEPEPQQASSPLWVLVSVPPWPCTQSRLRQY